MHSSVGDQNSAHACQDCSSSDIRTKKRLSLLDGGRGIAAFMVVIFHANASSPYFGGPQFDWMRTLEVGVDFFFVLSGYVIMSAHISDIGHSHTVARYLRNRAIRLFPTLWFVVILTALGQALFSNGFDTAQFVRSMFPFPSLLEARPQVIWTLRHELLFYAVFGLLLLSKRIGLYLVALWLAGTLGFFAFSLASDPASSLAWFFFSTFHLNFLMGAALCLWHQRHRTTNGSAWPVLLGIALLAFWLAVRGELGLSRLGLSDYSSDGATLGVLITGLACAFVVHGLACAEPLFKAPNWLVGLGASSYLLYLAHTPLNSLTQRAAAHLPSSVLEWGGGHIALIAVGVAVSHWLHLYVEQPALRWLRGRGKARSH